MKTNVYKVEIQWAENSSDENFVRMTERQAKIIENGLTSARNDEAILGFSVIEMEPDTESFEGALHHFRQGVLYKYFGPRDWTPKVGRLR